MLYNLAIVIYDLLVHFAAPFSRKPRKMMKASGERGAVYLVSRCFAWRV